VKKIKKLEQGLAITA